MAAVELERKRQLEDTALSLQKLLTASAHGVNPMLETALANIFKQIEVLENEAKESEHRTEQAVAAQIAEQEATLNREEKRVFAGFVEKEYFTKKDFGSLEDFYRNSWDKLTDNGKSEMSKRLHEGIVRHEYIFDELPEVIQEKDSDFLQEQKGKSAMAVIPQPEHSKNEESLQSLSNIDLSTVDLSKLSIGETNNQLPASVQNLRDAREQKTR
ncbi:MAG TPA: hypothetical protein VG347_08495 [Verrucomicrobiae bacterium]|nr:hypothetical protein [Verrucomicrobiae bacterium]